MASAYPKDNSGSESPQRCASTTSSFPLAVRPGYVTRRRERLTLHANYFDIYIHSNLCLHEYFVRIHPRCPPMLNRVIVKEFAKTFGEMRLMYDGLHNMYSRNTLRIAEGAPMFEVRLPESTSLFHVEIRWVKKHRLRGRIAEQRTKDLTNALDVVLRQRNSEIYLPIGRSFFVSANPYFQNLGQGKQVWQGFHQQVVPCERGMLLHLDTCNAAFYKEQSVIELLKEVLETDDLGPRLTDRNRLKLEQEMRGMKVQATHGSRRRYKVSGISRRSAAGLSFPLLLSNGAYVDCVVPKYFREFYHIELVYPKLQCLVMSQNGSTKFLPMELCRVVGGQRCLKRLTDQQTTSMTRTNVCSAAVRKGKINRLVRGLEFDRDRNLMESGLGVSTDMVEVPAQVLVPPTISYGTSRSDLITPEHGVWEMEDKTFFTARSIKCWALVCFAPNPVVPSYSISNFASILAKTAMDMGMYMSTSPKTYYVHPSRVIDVFRDLTKDRRLQLIVLVLNGKSGLYAEIKRQGDVAHGIVTQCVQQKNVVKITAEAMSNLCLKINSKLGGTNNILLPDCRPALFRCPVIIFGACLVHSPTGDPCQPTIAAVVASMDAHPFRYRASVKVQRRKHNTIQDLTAMVKDLLCKFYIETQFKPVRIVFYRDGVTEERFNQTLSVELVAIRRACVELQKDYQPAITYLTVQKRHFTRLFHMEGHRGVSSLPTGTLVDRVISHKSYFDFYLCSHTAAQGTSKPTHYHVLWDDSKLSPDVIYNLTYQLCHTNARCNKSVSVPAPVYYSYLTGYRARVHLFDREFRTNGANDEEDALLREMNRQVAVHEESYKMMYFI